MTDSALDKSRIFYAARPYMPFDLAAELLRPISSLERSLRYTPPTFSSGRGKMRLGGGSHSSSKTTRGRARARSGNTGHRHDNKEKRWGRDTVESLEQQADRILGEYQPMSYIRCDRKKDYESWSAAEERAERWSKLKGRLYNAYECPDCNGIHIGRADKTQITLMRREAPELYEEITHEKEIADREELLDSYDDRERLIAAAMLNGEFGEESFAGGEGAER